MERRQRGLFSVTNKYGLGHFAPLLEHGWEFVSTGGTAKTMGELGMPTIPVEEVTGFPEMMGGRLKTIHPLIAGGLLARRDDEGDMASAREFDIHMIDLLVVNLYDFAGNPSIEQIDIGGPTLLRAAAKSYKDVIVLVDPDDYEEVVDRIIGNGVLGERHRRHLARKVFLETAGYDAVIASWLK